MRNIPISITKVDSEAPLFHSHWYLLIRTIAVSCNTDDLNALPVGSVTG